MTRTVRQLNATRTKPDEATPRLFSEFANHTNLVLLGDPGAGKTHLFRASAKAEGAKFLTARRFLVTPAQSLAGKVLFIDGLDEKRAGRKDRDTIDALVSKFFDVMPAKVRISCRVADWLGESDLRAIAPYFEQSEATPPVLLLEKLRSDEQIAVLAQEGVASVEAKTFLTEANERGLSEFLENPQNLIMLWRAVKTGTWPETRKSLFELSTQLMLQEADRDHARSGAGIYTVADLRPIAGAICAARLISDVEAIGLTEQDPTTEIPGYRSLTFLDPEKVRAALTRRVFIAGSEPESVDYAHRTTAEYLGAAFLAQKIRDGLPLGRILALIGVENHPAPELRGLHAWLAVHLPEYADQLIQADPYGVLTYGDAASLSRSSCIHLMKCLDAISKKNPGFRSGNWQSYPIGALARRDMVPEFQAALRDADAGFGFRSVIVDALWLGTPLPELIPELTQIVARDAAPYAERLHAALALLRYGDAGRTAVVEIFKAGLGSTSNGLRLRCVIVKSLYGVECGAVDIINIANDALETADTLTGGTFWTLGDSIPLADLSVILDGIKGDESSFERQGYDRRSSEVGSFYSDLLILAFRAPVPLDPIRALNWLFKRMTFSGAQRSTRTGDLRLILAENPERLQAVADAFFQTLPAGDHGWYRFHEFQKAIFFQLAPDALLRSALSHLKVTEDRSERQTLLYELCLNLSFQIPQPDAGIIFEALFALADSKPFLADTRERMLAARLPDRYLDTRASNVVETENSREMQRQQFDRDEQRIREGMHAGWVRHLGLIYFGQYSDVDLALAPRQRLAEWLGEEKVESALVGLQASLLSQQVPTFDEVLALLADHQQRDHWRAFVAGLNERWETLGFKGLSSDLLKALVAFDLTNPVSILQGSTQHWVVHPWKEALLEKRPELVRDVYLAVVRTRLSRNESHADGLRELLTDAPFAPFRREIVLELLRDFPNACPHRLNELLDAVIKLPSAHSEFLSLAELVLSGQISMDAVQRDSWLVTAYLLSPSAYEEAVAQRAVHRRELVFGLRDRVKPFLQLISRDDPSFLQIIEFIAQLTGALYPEAHQPIGGWCGDNNPWDASEYCRQLFALISTMPNQAAANSLKRLGEDPKLTSYKPSILYALANQQQRQRDAEYHRPNWPQTVLALDNKTPATVADLFALLKEHFRDLKTHIERENTDIFKRFWNVDSYGRPDTPRPEELCRDEIVGLLRPALAPLGISVEPEAHMVADKRADISVAMAGRKILCELKRDCHPELWTAIEQQLERFYAHDPEAKGFGVYCVFWFGDKSRRSTPTPPSGLDRPRSGAEMTTMLSGLLAEDMKNRIAIVVIDVTGRL